MDAGEFLDKWDGDKDLGWPERYAEDYVAAKVEEIAGGLAEAVNFLLTAPTYECYCDVMCDPPDLQVGKDGKCSYCTAKSALAAYHEAVGR